VGRDVGRADGGLEDAQETAGAAQIETSRDREYTFEPRLLRLRRVRQACMQKEILARHAKCLITRDFKSALRP